MAATQEHRSFDLKTPLGKDVLLVRQMSGTEALSEPFQWDLDLLSEKGDINAEDLLGQKVSLSFTMANGQKRYFHGYVTEFSQGGWLQRYHRYHATVRPWYWLLTRTADCRIFQAMTVPQIFEQVVQQYGFTDYELRLSGTYQTREYCVQYRETDFNFLSRLLEHEGIYFFFEHAASKHSLVLTDDPSQHEAVAGYETVPYYAPGGKDALRERDHLESWSYTKKVQPGSYATTDYDFEKPRKSLTSSATISRQHQQSTFEVFDYPGALSQLESSQSEATTKVRIQELHADYMVAHGQGNAAGLAVGCKFTLEKFPRKDLNMAYVVTRANYDMSTDVYESGRGHEAPTFSVWIDAIDARTPYRPPRLTRKPMIHGAQTAMVVGPAGEEIFTDKHGRVKVQFPWDRYGTQNQESSCWIRVAQMWAGKNWGMIQVPRIGQEVIVTFLEGDPDRPIITGRVYNGDAMAPYGLPESATQSGIKSRSTKGGGDANFNEIRFEDLKGSEQLYIHAEKNQDGVVENDHTHTVGHDQTYFVGNDRTKTVNNDEKTQIGNNRTENVGNSETVTVAVDRTHTVGANEQVNIGANRTEGVGANETIGITANRTITVGGNETASVAMRRTHNVGINEMINIGAAQEVSVGAAQAITVGAAQVTSVGLEQMTNVGLHRSVNVGGSQSHHVGASRKAHVTADDHLHVGKSLTIHAGESVTIKTGESSIHMHRDGTITIKGNKITVHGSDDIHVKATGDVVMKGSKIKHN